MTGGTCANTNAIVGSVNEQNIGIDNKVCAHCLRCREYVGVTKLRRSIRIGNNVVKRGVDRGPPSILGTADRWFCYAKCHQ
jgi:hypothetical protein